MSKSSLSTFVEFKLKHVKPYNHNTAKYVFELYNGQASLLPIASCVVDDELKQGEKLTIKGSIMMILYKINEHDQVGMIVGSTGITPMYQVLECALKDPSNKTKFALIFANISQHDILLHEEFDALKKAHPSTFNAIYTLDQPGSNWKGYKRFVNREVIKQNIASTTLGDKVKVFICVYGQMVEDDGGMKKGACMYNSLCSYIYM
ncbi:ferredoxin reductase-like protein [Laetiporus sulphureus 93-53]|uniref:Ferredoxin reductase-like protein n=1 Tax=Laetiporus sulphureus 93-53 TaxID=1314785 RepID=A0A165CSF3_9APHY|nr:ferredoxin reductase-like protein [Laetiporus sulphureus 93-53]KZT03356.1 ferredoxin reductase-like protein [Laetiporus sulphureus 93-53]